MCFDTNKIYNEDNNEGLLCKLFDISLKTWNEPQFMPHNHIANVIPSDNGHTSLQSSMLSTKVYLWNEQWHMVEG